MMNLGPSFPPARKASPLFPASSPLYFITVHLLSADVRHYFQCMTSFTSLHLITSWISPAPWLWWPFRPKFNYFSWVPRCLSSRRKVRSPWINGYSRTSRTVGPFLYLYLFLTHIFLRSQAIALLTSQRHDLKPIDTLRLKEDAWWHSPSPSLYVFSSSYFSLCIPIYWP